VQPFFGGTAAPWNLPAGYTYSENGLGRLIFEAPQQHNISPLSQTPLITHNQSADWNIIGGDMLPQWAA
jgi:hypothetical protein